jgi:hypothetical protein
VSASIKHFFSLLPTVRERAGAFVYEVIFLTSLIVVTKAKNGAQYDVSSHEIHAENNVYVFEKTKILQIFFIMAQIYFRAFDV